MGPGAGHPTSNLDAAQVSRALKGATKFGTIHGDVSCDLFKRRPDPPQVVKGEKGDAGPPGPPGKDGDPQIVITAVKEWLTENKDLLRGTPGVEGKPGLNGTDGKTPTRDELVALIREVFAAEREALKGQDGTINVVVRRLDGSVKEFKGLRGGTVEIDVREIDKK